MNKYFLNFFEAELEEKYKQTKADTQKNQIFLLVLILIIVINISVTIIHILEIVEIETIVINISFTFAIGSMGMFLINQKMRRHVQIGITIMSLALAFLQININQGNTTKQEFFAYGNMFMQLQCVLYFISDFPSSLVQITFHYIMRILITSYISERIDFLGLTISTLSGFLAVMTIYFSERNSKNFFLMNLKNESWNDKLQTLLQKPFVEINFIEETQNFTLLSSYNIDQFPGFKNEFCFGCNCRYFLRNYFISQSQQTIEKFLIDTKEQKFRSEIDIKYKKIKTSLRVTYLNIEHKSFIIVLNKEQGFQQQNNYVQEEKNQLQNNFKKKQFLIHQKIYCWGIESILYLREKFVNEIDINLLLTYLTKIYTRHLSRRLNIHLQNQKKLQIITFPKQLKIFMIQIFDSISIISCASLSCHIHIDLVQNFNTIDLIISSKESSKIFQLINQNYFVMKLELLLTQEMVLGDDNKLTIQFINYAKESFIFSEKT